MMAVVSWQLAQAPTTLPGMTELAEALGSIIIHTSPIWNGPGADGPRTLLIYIPGRTLDGPKTKPGRSPRHGMALQSFFAEDASMFPDALSRPPATAVSQG
jgi:hypothetical protein